MSTHEHGNAGRAADAGGAERDTRAGRTLGGSSSINALVYLRGQPQDYDDWARKGLSDWSFAHCLPYFRKSETSDRGPSLYRGDSGPLHVQSGRLQSPRACRKHFWRQLSPSQGRYFHALLTFCSPKRRASKSFWSLTVQPPEKPKPFRSHSIASKPAMVRRAVLKDWKPPIFGMFFFTRKWSLSIPCWRCLVT